MPYSSWHAPIAISTALSNSSLVMHPSIWRSTISSVEGTMAIGTSASPKLSSSLFRSSRTFPSALPAAQAGTMSLMGMPASASATEAAVSPAHLVPALACRISMYTSMDARG